MPIQIQFRRGASAEHETFTGAPGEITVDTTNNTLRAFNIWHTHPPHMGMRYGCPKYVKTAIIIGGREVRNLIVFR